MTVIVNGGAGVKIKESGVSVIVPELAMAKVVVSALAIVPVEGETVAGVVEMENLGQMTPSSPTSLETLARFGKVTVQVSPTRPVIAAFEVSVDVHVEQFVLTKFIEPSAVIEIVIDGGDGVVRDTGVSVRVPDPLIVKVVTPVIMIDPLDGLTVEGELPIPT